MSSELLTGVSPWSTTTTTHSRSPRCHSISQIISDAFFAIVIKRPRLEWQRHSVNPSVKGTCHKRMWWKDAHDWDGLAL